MYNTKINSLARPVVANANTVMGHNLVSAHRDQTMMMITTMMMQMP